MICHTTINFTKSILNAAKNKCTLQNTFSRYTKCRIDTFYLRNLVKSSYHTRIYSAEPSVCFLYFDDH